MDPQTLASVIGIAGALGVFGWQLKLYGTQREHEGKLDVLERAWMTTRSDHDTVVRLETEFAHMSEQLSEIRQAVQHIDSKLDGRSRG